MINKFLIMQNIKKLIRRGWAIIAVFSLVVLLTKCSKPPENVQNNNACDTNDNICCTCTATYISVGQVAATQQVCTPAEKQNFMMIWTDPLVRIECKR